MRALTLIGVALSSLLLMAAAPDPAEQLADPAMEATARALFQDIRCVVCQNESIDDSQADLAKDLRGLIRQQVAQGKSPEDVRQFMIERYGEYILLKPRFSLANLALWLGPVLVLMVGLLWLRALVLPAVSETPLSQAEEEELRQLMDKKT